MLDTTEPAATTAPSPMVIPDKIIDFFPLGFFDFKVAKRLTLFFSLSKVLNDVAPSFFKISSQ